MIRKIYNQISNAILRRRYRRLYCRLFWHYAEKFSTAKEAGFHASEAFQWITSYNWVDWACYLLPEIYPPKVKENPSDQLTQCKDIAGKAKSYKPDITTFEHLRETVEYPAESVTGGKLRKNLLAFRMLKLMGFTLLPTWDNSEKGGLLYFSASALPVRWKSPIEA